MVSKRIYFATVLFFILSLTGILIYFLNSDKKVAQSKTLAQNKQCQYKYLNPLRCEPDLAKKKKEYVALRNELIKFIEQEKKNGHIKSVSVYFRDMQNGPIMSINSSENFTPASLLKLPIMIAYYKKAQDDPVFLKRMITIPDSSTSVTQNIKPGYSLEKGKSYTIDELITVLITRSDNISSSVLLSYLGMEDLVFILSDLGIVDPKMDAAKQFITVQNYSSIFRILYNASYLDHAMSNKALELLSKSEFKDGLAAGLPENTKLAHKFGERDYAGQRQLHDCGIIYYPDNPYTLCVMTRGDDFKELQDIIKTISEKVYKEFDSRKN